ADDQLQPNTPGQSYNNCGVESARQIINASGGAPVTQEGLLNHAMANGWADSVPGSLYQSGGTRPADRVAILQANGVPAGTMLPTVQNLETAVAEGRGIIVSVYAGDIWPPSAGLNPGNGTHAILVTGVEYDAKGNHTNVIVNDTG